MAKQPNDPKKEIKDILSAGHSVQTISGKDVGTTTLRAGKDALKTEVQKQLRNQSLKTGAGAALLSLIPGVAIVELLWLGYRAYSIAESVEHVKKVMGSLASGKRSLTPEPSAGDAIPSSSPDFLAAVAWLFVCKQSREYTAQNMTGSFASPFDDNGGTHSTNLLSYCRHVAPEIIQKNVTPSAQWPAMISSIGAYISATHPELYKTFKSVNNAWWLAKSPMAPISSTISAMQPGLGYYQDVAWVSFQRDPLLLQTVLAAQSVLDNFKLIEGTDSPLTVRMTNAADMKATFRSESLMAYLFSHELKDQDGQAIQLFANPNTKIVPKPTLNSIGDHIQPKAMPVLYIDTAAHARIEKAIRAATRPTPSDKEEAIPLTSAQLREMQELDVPESTYRAAQEEVRQQEIKTLAKIIKK